jgi:tetratricopeptide (TPR) repeat protein
LGNVKIVADNKEMYLISPVFKQEIGVEKCRMYYLGENTFKVNNYPNLIQFNINNVLEGITIFKDKTDEKKLKISLDKIRTPETELTEIFSENKFEAAVAKFNKLKLKYPSINFENALNTLGYSFFNEKKNKLSIQIFSLNCKEYPNFWNAYDSLGEIYGATGDLALAKLNYLKSLDLNPSNNNAKEMILKIEKRLSQK